MGSGVAPLARLEAGNTRRDRFIEEQIIGIRKAHQAGVAVSDPCREHGVDDAGISKWKAEYGGIEGEAGWQMIQRIICPPNEAERLRALEDENAELTRMLADAMLDNVTLKDPARERGGDARREAECRRPFHGHPRDERTGGV